MGGALALSGLTFQGIFRNPLADPYILGISSGAAAGAACVFVFCPEKWLFFLVPCGAFAGAMLTLGAVLLISGAGRSSTERLLLSGVVTGVVVSSLLIYLISISNSDQLAGVTWWMLGDLQGSSELSTFVFALFCAGILAGVRFFANELNALALGDEEASLRGVSVKKLRLFFVLAGSLLAALCVAVSGIIGFAGLVVPHMVRLLFGSDHRRTVLPVFIFGGCFLQACDLAAALFSRVREMPVGVTTSCIGGIVFLLILSKRR